MMVKVNDSLRPSTQAHQGSWALIPMLHTVLLLSLNASCMQMTNTNYKWALVADFIDKEKKYKKIFLKVPCELGWKLHAKLTSYIFMLHRQFLMQVLVWLYRKTDGDGDEKLISLFPLRPTLLHPLGVRAMFCKFQADENSSFVPCHVQGSYEVNE